MLACFKLLVGDWLHAVFKEPTRHCGAEPGAHCDSTGVVGSNGEGKVLVVIQELPALVIRELLVHLDVLATGQPNNASTLVTV